MKFPWSKPSAYEVVNALLNEFTPEEKAILDGKDCAVPRMYSLLLEKAATSELAWEFDLDSFRRLMSNLFPKKERIRDPQFQKNLFYFFNSFLRCRR